MWNNNKSGLRLFIGAGSLAAQIYNCVFVPRPSPDNKIKPTIMHLIGF